MHFFLALPVRTFVIFFLSCSFFLSSCTTTEKTVAPATPVPGPAHSVTRTEALSICEAYRTHRWTPTKQNQLHGTDTKGIRVDTPDGIYALDEGCIWLPHQEQTGIPYKWGGFDTPEQFDQKISQGFAAGDIHTAEKRQLDNNAVSSQAAGIDCSGLVSRAWRLAQVHDTKALPTICTQLESFQDLLPGDILNVPGYHVIVFVRQINDEYLLGYHAAAVPYWGVHLGAFPMEYIQEKGYVALRYYNIQN